MKKTTWLCIAILALLGGSCAPTLQETGRRSAAGLEPYEVAVDKSCAYFHFLWAKAAELEGNLEEAQFAYERALVCDRQAEYAMRNLAMLLIRMDKRQQAITWVNKILAASPADAGAQSLLANLYVSIGETAQAVKTYQDILAKDPKNQNVMLMLGSLYASNRDYEKAQATLEQLVQAYPDFYAGYYYLAKLYRELRLNQKALAAYEQALAINWSTPLAYEVAELYDSLSRHEESAQIYRRLLEEDAGDERARGLLANNLLQTNRIDEALAELRELRNYTGEVLRVDLTIGRILLDYERYDEAIDHLNAMLAEDPAQEGVRSLLVLAYYRKGEIAIAKEMLAAVAPGMPGYDDAVLMLARLLHEEKDFAAAEKVLQKAIVTPGSRKFKFYVALAMMYREQGDAIKGVAVFEQAQKDFPRDAKVRFEYGLFLERLGKSAEALAKMHEVLALEPRNPYALNYVGYMWADQGVNLNQAREYIEDAVAQRPEDGFIRDSLGWVYYRLGDYARAVTELEKAVELADEDPTIYEHLGDAYLKVGKIAEAIEAYGLAVEFHSEETDKESVRRKLEALPGQ